MRPIIVPPCQAACPINTDVRGYVSAIARGDAEEALRVIRRVNPLPSVCGRICTRRCETACRRAQVDAPVAIRALKRYAADLAIGQSFFTRPLSSYPEKVAIVGSGPSGLVAAHDLALLGYSVTLFEARPVLGGLLSEGIPKYRLPKEIVQREIGAIVSLGIEVKTGVRFGKEVSLDGLLWDFDAVFIAVGSGKGIVPQCDGVDLSGVFSGVDFLKEVDRGDRQAPGRRVVVIGGGHTAIDAARTCIRLGVSEVTVVYRRSLEEMPAGKEEVLRAEEEGVRFVYCAAPIRFIGKTRVERVRFARTALGEPEESGRRRPVPLEGSEFDLEADAVILAIGYAPDAEEIKEAGLKVGERGTIVVMDETGATDITGVFAAGDVVTGPMSVVDAMASGRKAAGAIHRYFRRIPDNAFDRLVSLRPLETSVTAAIQKSERQEPSLLPREQRTTSFDEVESALDHEQARREALRCLNCGAGATVDGECAACLNCVRVCPFGIPAMGAQTVEIDVAQCQACGICAAECPACAIHLKDDARYPMRPGVDRVLEKAREESPDIVVTGFYCCFRHPLGPPVERHALSWIPVLCLGRLRESDILYPFEVGAEGILLVSCRDEECRFGRGVRLLAERVERVKTILDDTGIGGSRLSVVAGDDECDRFIRGIERLGINPVRTGKRVAA